MVVGHVYKTLIDHWLGWRRLDQEIVALAKSGCGAEAWEVEHLIMLLSAAAYAFTRAGWEGDGIWKISALAPVDDGGGDSRVMLAVKQSNNGTTFIFSELVIPWLEE
jgi:hypothetical protein